MNDYPFSLGVLSVVLFCGKMRETWNGGLALNRFIVLGWNSINLGLLCYLLIRQRGQLTNQWFSEMRKVFRFGAIAYAIWGMIVLLIVPWLMRYEHFQIVEEMLRSR